MRQEVKGLEEEEGAGRRERSTWGRAEETHHQEELQIQACDWPQGDDAEVQAGLSALRDRKLKEEGEDGEEVGVDVVEREVQRHGSSPGETRTHTHTPCSRCKVLAIS